MEKRLATHLGFHSESVGFACIYYKADMIRANDYLLTNAYKKDSSRGSLICILFLGIL